MRCVVSGELLVFGGMGGAREGQQEEEGEDRGWKVGKTRWRRPKGRTGNSGTSESFLFSWFRSCPYDGFRKGIPALDISVK